MTKLFLDHKTIFYDLDPFLFYVLFENDTLVGYFSKEKYSVEGYNLSCILVLPPYQNKRYGRLLIEFSYELCKLKKVIGGPERPLSDLGFKGYLSYWKTVILSILGLNPTTTFTLGELSVLTSINQSDILLVLSACELLDHWKDGNVCIEMEKIKVEEKMSIDSSCIIITRNFY
ncbi:Histone acetyltransferase KAT5 [Terramyces sp. JEL0728]|nr:Histone acetyltransferase KAT5 [Terramyces sp. JEL0728]